MRDLTPEEEKYLEQLLRHAPEIVSEAKYRESKTIFWKKWRTVVTTAAIVVGAIAALQDTLWGWVQWLFR